MSENPIEKKHHRTFEQIRRTNEHDQEFWSARDLAKALDYAEYRNFLPVIDKAKTACKNSKQRVEDHFVELHEMIPLGKGLKKSHQILDHMGSTELAANLFRATQTEEKLRRDGIKGKSKANRTHHDVGVKVRQTIKDLGGTMPEDLPTPKDSIKKLARDQQKKLEEGETS